MKRLIEKCSTPVLLAPIALVSAARVAADTNLESTSTAVQGDLTHAIVTLAILVGLVAISRIAKKSS